MPDVVVLDVLLPRIDDYIVKPLMEYHFLGRIARFAKPQKS